METQLNRSRNGIRLYILLYFRNKLNQELLSHVDGTLFLNDQIRSFLNEIQPAKNKTFNHLFALHR